MSRLPQSALIVQHPNAPVRFDPPPTDPRDPVVADPYPETLQSRRAAWLATNRERAEARKLGVPYSICPPLPKPLFKMPSKHRSQHDDERGDQIERNAAMDLLEDMVDRFGLQRVQRWLRLAANLRGQEVS